MSQRDNSNDKAFQHVLALGCFSFLTQSLIASGKKAGTSSSLREV